jgi:hypothetical protein
MIGHGYYLRKVKSKERVYQVWIKRWQCKECRHTSSSLPDFLLEYRHYLVEDIHEVVSARWEAESSWTGMEKSCGKKGAPVLRTMQRWSRSYGEQAERWLRAVQATIAEQDSSSGWLEVHGEAARARDTGTALLKASEHLLAWAKTQWQELGGYGRKDRLRFLWLWGANRGLGRLV